MTSSVISKTQRAHRVATPRDQLQEPLELRHCDHPFDVSPEEQRSAQDGRACDCTRRRKAWRVPEVERARGEELDVQPVH